MKQMNTPQYVTAIKGTSYTTLNMSSPFKGASAAFNWLATEYPTSHTHDHWEILLVMSGAILHRINNCEMTLQKGDACLIRPNDNHSLHQIPGATEPYQHLNFTFDSNFAESIISLYDNFENILNEPDYIRFYIDAADRGYLYDRALLVQNLSQNLYEKNAKFMISFLIIKYMEQKILFDPGYPMWLNNFILQISSPHAFGKSIQELAKSTPYSYSRLSRIFKEYTGETIVNYINSQKMTYSKRLLRSTDMTTLSISEMIGYESLSSFNHLFKERFGITPSEYRKQQTTTQK